MTAASSGVGTKAYMPLELFTSRKINIKAMEVGLEDYSTVLPSPLCANTMLPLAAALAIIKAMLHNDSITTKNNEKAAESGNYLTKQPETLVFLEHKSTLAMVDIDVKDSFNLVIENAML